MTEARKNSRRRVLKGAVAAFNNKFSTLNCQVRDISGTGCRLRVDKPMTFPARFCLDVELDGLVAECEIVWRRDFEVGVRFVGEPKSIEPKRLQVVQPTIRSDAGRSLRM